ncbi:MAG: NAD(P)/FAD-dependent oxidoreductase [Promethearchaeota archaeon]
MGENTVHDVAIIGCGVTGAATAWALARYDVDTAVVERFADVGMGTSKANSAILHAGYAAPVHKLKTKYNVEANPMFDRVCSDLKVPFKRIGSFVVAIRDDQLPGLHELYENGRKAGVPVEVIDDEARIRELEPELSRDTRAILWAPTAGIVSPYELAIRMAELAARNGTEFHLGSPVTDIVEKGDYFEVKTPRGTVRARFVVNAAGLYADKIASMVLGDPGFEIRAWKGEYLLLDKNSIQINHVLFPMPTKESKGIVVTPTIHGNVIVGPNNVLEPDREDVATTNAGIWEIIEGGDSIVPNIPLKKTIRNFAGLRAKAHPQDDFIIGPTPVDGFFNAAGIQSPGLSSCLAIGEDLVRMMGQAGLELRDRENYVGVIPDWFRINDSSPEELQREIARDPRAGHVVCRCETITEREIVEQIRRPLGATTLDGVKFRCRAQMGRCQGGFCTPKILKILSRELGIPVEEVTKRGEGTAPLVGRTKGLPSEVWTE